MKKLFDLLLCFCLLLSCNREAEPSGGGKLVNLRVEGVLADDGKSVLVNDACSVSGITVYAYRNGNLETAADSKDGEAYALVRLKEGERYDIYVLANCVGVEAPFKEDAIKDMRCNVNDHQLFSGGVPMSSIEPLSICAGENTSVSVYLERMASKYSLKIDKRLELSDFELESVLIRQAALDMTPFCAESTPLELYDGDSSTELDVISLSGGGEAAFYLLENCRGVLLPDNRDQWSKVPDNIPGQKDSCTFLEVKGRWTSPGVSSSITYRMYLGRDNCSDFNIDRNTENTIVLSLTDSGSLSASWKVERTGINDIRRLSFKEKTLTVIQGHPAVEAELEVFPQGLRYETVYNEAELKEAALSVTENTSSLLLSSKFSGPQKKTLDIVVRTWDSALSDTLKVVVDYAPGEFVDFEIAEACYTGQWGCLHFPSADKENPVSVKVFGTEIEIGAGISGGKAYQKVGSADSDIVFYYVSDTQDLYYTSEAYSLSSSDAVVKISRFPDETTVTIRKPDRLEYGLEDIVLTECGNSKCDESGYYDNQTKLCLFDAGGQEINSYDKFRKPDALISAMGKTPCALTRMEDFLNLYIVSLEICCVFGTEKYLNVNEWCSVNLVQNPDPEDGSYLACLRSWGLKADGDRIKEGTVSVENKKIEDSRSVAAVEIKPAFPSQRFLGTFANRQLSNGSLKSSGCDVDMTECGMFGTPYSGADWTVCRGLFETNEIPSAENIVDDFGKSSRQIIFDGSRLEYSTPPETELEFPSGAFLLVGSAVNPHSGRTVIGYYSLDIVLYVPVGVQVDFSFDGNQLYYSFVPFTRYASRENSNRINGLFPVVEILSFCQSKGYETSYMKVPRTMGDNSCSMNLAQKYDNLSGSIYYSCSFIRFKTDYQAFWNYHFLLYGQLRTKLEYTRNGYRETLYYNNDEYVSGSRGYFIFEKQTDLNSIPEESLHYGLDNMLIESAFGDFSGKW